MRTLSLILPYWQRKEATDTALLRLAELYPSLDMEVVIVDDGSDREYYAPPKMPWPVLMRRLPAKSKPKNPCLPINVGAFASGGRCIAISNPEILHRTPVLEPMLDEIRRGGAMTYVTAAAWSPETKRWHAHSTRAPLCADRTDIRMPEGAQYHFLAMFTRDMWTETGGFDNDFREGAGYDDNDFLMRAGRAGARFVQRDDLVVDHPRGGARAEWTAPMYARNRELFMSKWGK